MSKKKKKKSKKGWLDLNNYILVHNNYVLAKVIKSCIFPSIRVYVLVTQPTTRAVKYSS